MIWHAFEVAALFLVAMCSMARAVSAQGPDPSAKARAMIPVLELHGSSLERGREHGRALKPLIREQVRRWKENMAKQTGMEPDTFIRQFIARTHYQTALAKWTPELLEEIRGIAEGAECDFDTIYVYQFIDEYWIQSRTIPAEHCTSLGMGQIGRQPSIVAQTMDVESFRDGGQVVLHIHEPGSDREVLVLTSAGCIGLNGLNSSGVGVCCNTLMQLKNKREGLPVNAVIRGVLRCDSFALAERFLREIHHASGQNYILGGAAEVASFECSANKVVRFRPLTANPLVWHTNHPLANDDLTDGARLVPSAADRPSTPRPQTDSQLRLASVERRLQAGSTVSRLELVRSILASKDEVDHPICISRPREEGKPVPGNFSFSATIMVLSDPPELYATYGPPDESSYKRLTFSTQENKKTRL
jgi:isopenicillin-N N-acyltransferase like protein